MLIIREEDVKDLIDFKEAVDIIERALEYQAEGEAQLIPRSRIFMREKVYHVMAASIEPLDVVGLKTYLSIPGRTSFAVIIFSIRSGEILSLIEADLLGRIRTGAASAIATKYLARKDVKALGIIGSGRQSYTQALAILSIRYFDHIFVSSLNRENSEIFVKRLREKGYNAFVADSLHDLFIKSDVISSATNSRQPFIKAEYIKDGLHVNLVGSNHPNRAEAYPEVFLKTRLVVTDSIEQAKRESGDLIEAVRKGYIYWEKIHELWELVVGRVSRSSEDEVTLFKSHGVALWDVALAKLIYEKARSKGVGQEISFSGFWRDRYF
ncbi:MAG: ornithine cyclodeaminase family protein [Desulfurococcales archaeon]|nr:ornithine cyclodeaminase family protein [Desulfurococcales archaeon]